MPRLSVCASPEQKSASVTVCKQPPRSPRISYAMRYTDDIGGNSGHHPIEFPKMTTLSANDQQSSKPVDIREWKISTYGSIKGYNKALDETQGDEWLIARLHQKMREDICENTGIPYYGWVNAVLQCVRIRGDGQTILAALGMQGRRSAYSHWVDRYTDRTSAYFIQPKEELHQYF